MILLCLVAFEHIEAQLLYEIYGKGLKKSSYILGTHHAVPISSLVHIDNVFRCYNDCDAVVGEIVISEDSMIVNRMSEAATMNGLITDFLTQAEAESLDSALQKVLNLKLHDVAHLRPAMIQNIYEMTLYEKYFPAREDDSSMDSFFQILSIDQGKEIYGLESIDMQIELLLRSHTVQRQAQMLMATIRNTDKLQHDIEKLNNLYLSENLDSLYNWAIDFDRYSEDDIYRFVDKRNLAWIDKIVEYIKIKPCFIAVGALHLPGKTGILELLRKCGYKVRAVI